ncbi:hypothetical protein [Azospirillum canadense]|uniref:hypothetical protein n=1 Tax=Azospirillum canadense TaxID=403962 RepID=UPI002226EDAB|nr:hypothetical protein [Azospirillum canadense]MCW2238031.1 hypothetical protein [Azospirillum canadense]
MSKTGVSNASPYWNPLGETGGDGGTDGDEHDEGGQAEGGTEDARDRRRERAAAVLARRIRRRASMRDLARALLIGALVTLAVLAVEIGRKAFVVIHRADLTTSTHIA